MVLLSLVRSNAEREVGFTKTENRAIVSLSRAREGFFIVGNGTTTAIHCPLHVKLDSHWCFHSYHIGTDHTQKTNDPKSTFGSGLWQAHSCSLMRRGGLSSRSSRRGGGMLRSYPCAATTISPPRQRWSRYVAAHAESTNGLPQSTRTAFEKLTYPLGALYRA